jgi:tetratricopeptide (TPR) repeat protein
LEDRTAEIGFLGNLGIVAEWKGQVSQSVDIFQEVLEFVQESGDQNAQIQALRHLTKGYEKLKDDQKIIEYTAMGLELTRDHPNEITFVFSEMLIAADYRLGRFEDAHQATIEAIELARLIRDDVREVNLLLSLGESYMIAEMYEEALETYQQAREGANKIHRSVDSAYLTGRIGVALAELERIDEAIAYHKEAVELAKQNDLPELAGEQLTMLTLAYLDKDMPNEAHSYCHAAMEVFTSAGLDQQAYNARKLDAKIENLVMDKQGD